VLPNDLSSKGFFMFEIFERLESRTLFSAGLATVTADYTTVVADASAIKADLAGIASSFKSDSTLIGSDIKVLGKSKQSSADAAKLKHALATATAIDTRTASHWVASGKAAIKRAQAAFLANLLHPTAANGKRLSSAVSAIKSAVTSDESSLSSITTTQELKLSTLLATVVADNPTDITLASDVASIETNATGALSALAAKVVATSTDINTLATDAL
jgi:hypothetical protein